MVYSKPMDCYFFIFMCVQEFDVKVTIALFESDCFFVVVVVIIIVVIIIIIILLLY